ncbi:MAG TPA: hypothetical protein VGJ60_22510 [Chloroflexota bacterium]|jgi:ElaB/YqjD/DUF883 family membrane-anchored ribosome-binding protein
MKFPKVPNSVSRVAIVAGAVLVLGGSAVGIAVAQTPPTPTPNAQQQGYQKFIDALAKRLGISSQQLQSNISQARQDAGLPANGGFGRGPGGPGGPRAGVRGFVDLQAAATALGMTPQQLRTALVGKSLAQVAGAKTTDVVNALTAAANKRIDEAQSNGRLTPDQANTAKTNAANRINQFVNQVMPQGGPGTPGGQGRGPGGPGGPGRGPFGFGFGMVQQGLDIAAQKMGITPQQLRTELASGKSLAQVASSHGTTGADVAAALKDAANKRIDDAQSNGRLTVDQANTAKTNIDQRIDQLVNQVMPQGVPGRGGPGGQQQDQTGA